MELRSQIARHAAAFGWAERPLASRLEFITADFDYSYAVVCPYQCSLNNQFERANFMKPEWPGYPELNIALPQDLLIHFKTDGFAAEISGSPGPDVRQSPESIRETQL
ncbi:MAG TPA: hypothetical protein VFT60_02910 [Bryobacteraceae bacterium]|nr:hypothetical protein [Bryobacteraceae bacterium]